MGRGAAAYQSAGKCPSRRRLCLRSRRRTGVRRGGVCVCVRLPVADRGGAARPAPPAEGETGRRQVRAALSRRRAGQGAAARGSPPAAAGGALRARPEPASPAGEGFSPPPAGSRGRLSSGAGAAAAGLFAERRRWRRRRRAPLAPLPARAAWRRETARGAGLHGSGLRGRSGRGRSAAVSARGSEGARAPGPPPPLGVCVRLLAAAAAAEGPRGAGPAEGRRPSPPLKRRAPYLLPPLRAAPAMGGP